MPSDCARPRCRRDPRPRTCTRLQLSKVFWPSVFTGFVRFVLCPSEATPTAKPEGNRSAARGIASSSGIRGSVRALCAGKQRSSAALECPQRALAIQSTRIPGEASIRTDNSMTGDYDRDRITPGRSSGRAHCLRMSRAPREFRIGDAVTVFDRGDRVPDADLPPSDEPVIAGGVGAVALGDVCPRRTCAKPPVDAI